MEVRLQIFRVKSLSESVTYGFITREICKKAYTSEAIGKDNLQKNCKLGKLLNFLAPCEPQYAEVI